MRSILKCTPALFLVALTGCADAPKAPVPIVVTTPEAPIASECNPRLRSRFPRIAKVAGNQTPLANVEDALIDAGKADLKNEVRETTCYCAQIAERGSAEEKANSKTLCATVKSKIKAPVGVWKSMATPFAGS